MEKPWENEPDRLEWRHRGVPCLIKRSHMGILCGYVGLPVARAEDKELISRVEEHAHGGITYGPEACDEDDPEGICHVPLPGEPEVRWVGFDCGHAYDVIPYLYERDRYRERPSPAPRVKYRDIAYVRQCCEQMADEVANASDTGSR